MTKAKLTHFRDPARMGHPRQSRCGRSNTRLVDEESDVTCETCKDVPRRIAIAKKKEEAWAENKRLKERVIVARHSQAGTTVPKDGAHDDVREQVYHDYSLYPFPAATYLMSLEQIREQNANLRDELGSPING